MTKKDILSIACKIFGIYLLIQTIVSSQYVIFGLVSLLSALTSGGEVDVNGSLITAGLLILPFLIFLYAAFYLIKQSDSIGGKLSGKTPGDNIQCAFDRDTLQQVLFSAIGVFMIASALTSIISTLGNMLGLCYIRESISGSMKLPTDMIRLEPIRLTGPIIKFIVESAIGLYLIFGSSKLVTLLKKLQHK